jgi:hydroxyacylglutathione hydrolase
MTAKFHVFPCLDDNIGVLIHDPETGATATIDAPAEEPILVALEETGWALSDILVTHKHGDHVEAVPALKERLNVRVVGPAAEANAIPGLDLGVREGDVVKVGSLAARIIETPGHTAGHIAYWLEADQALFAGDTLFALGCGRLFEGTPADMWRSLLKLRALPDETALYCGHEYTQSNAKFALAVDPENAPLRERAQAVAEARAAGRLTIPSMLGDEKATNPFLRADDPAFAAKLGLDAADPVAVFAALRSKKDNFR